MSEYINIISKEAITKPLQWPPVIIGVLAILGLIGVLIWATLTRNMSEPITLVLLYGIGLCGLVLLLITCAVCSIFFRVPTGNYEYTATIDKNNITVAEYEEFIEKYDPTIKDGIYYFTGGTLDE
jgi:hypothetical protein